MNIMPLIADIDSVFAIRMKIEIPGYFFYDVTFWFF